MQCFTWNSDICIAGSNAFSQTQNISRAGTTSPYELENGIPQGSVISPLLFAVMINNLPPAMNCYHGHYVDDCAIWDSGLFVLHYVQLSLTSINDWCTFHATKTVAMIFLHFSGPTMYNALHTVQYFLLQLENGSCCTAVWSPVGQRDCSRQSRNKHTPIRQQNSSNRGQS